MNISTPTHCYSSLGPQCCCSTKISTTNLYQRVSNQQIWITLLSMNPRHSSSPSVLCIVAKLQAPKMCSVIEQQLKQSLVDHVFRKVDEKQRNHVLEQAGDVLDVLPQVLQPHSRSLPPRQWLLLPVRSARSLPEEGIDVGSLLVAIASFVVIVATTAIFIITASAAADAGTFLTHSAAGIGLLSTSSARITLSLGATVRRLVLRTHGEFSVVYVRDELLWLSEQEGVGDQHEAGHHQLEEERDLGGEEGREGCVDQGPAHTATSWGRG